MDAIVFSFTTQEDWAVGFTFVDSAGAAVNMTGRSYKIRFYEWGTGTTVGTLNTADSSLLISGAGSNVISGRLDNSVTSLLAPNRIYGADLVWYSGSEDHRIIAAQVKHLIPGQAYVGAYTGSVRVAIDAATLVAGNPVSVQFAGPPGPAAWKTPVAWVTGTIYSPIAPADVVTSGGETYVCITAHTASALFATDLANWVKVSAVGATGPAAWAAPVTAWSTGVAYTATAPASVVTYNGASYVCVTSHTAAAAFATDAAKWVQLVAAGGLTFKRRETFTSSGTFTKQAGDVMYIVTAVGGGGGGGSGRRSAPGTQAGGGAGGNSAYVVERRIPASVIGATVSVAVGAGGAGGAAVGDSTNGNIGGQGGVSTFIGTSGSYSVYARGGGAGGGGTNAAGGSTTVVSADAYTASTYRPAGGANGNATTTGIGTSHNSGPSGGAGGAGLTSAGVEAAGGAAGTGDQTNGAAGNSSGGTAGTTVSPDGGAGSTPADVNFGSGGGGGASQNAAAAGNGGAGAQPGGGGGGGGGGRNGQTGGAGGAGGAGKVTIDVYG